jgi:hypothetical protein
MGVTKRCSLSLLSSNALVDESQCGGMGGGGGGCGVSANEYSSAHHVTWSPNKLWRSTSIFNLWLGPNKSTSGKAWVSFKIFHLRSVISCCLIYSEASCWSLNHRGQKARGPALLVMLPRVLYHTIAKGMS